MGEELKAWLAEDLDVLAKAVIRQSERVGLESTEAHSRQVWVDFLNFELEDLLANSAYEVKNLLESKISFASTRLGLDQRSRRNPVYKAVTRAKKLLVIVGARKLSRKR